MNLGQGPGAEARLGKRHLWFINLRLVRYNAAALLTTYHSKKAC